jgi:predicted DNA-binding transcriptional regulator AlpA
MKPRRAFPDETSAREGHPQLSLAIGAPASRVVREPPARRRVSGRIVKAPIALDEILWMRDVVQLTGKHRCTIHRWMNQGLFPPKNAPRGRPTGWLRSTIERWLLGPPPTTERGT